MLTSRLATTVTTATVVLAAATVVLAAVAGTAAAQSARAEEPAAPRHQASVSVMGLAGFLRVNAGSYVVAYERRLAGHHALRVAGDVIHVHHGADHVQVHQWTYGGSLGYRYHVTPAGGLFVGAEVGYRRGHGHHGRGTADHVMLENRQLRVLPELGIRLPHRRLPLALVTRVAAGWGPYRVTADRDDAAGEAAARYAQDVLAATSLVVDVELSLALAF